MFLKTTKLMPVDSCNIKYNKIRELLSSQSDGYCQQIIEKDKALLVMKIRKEFKNTVMDILET
jgi:hypothetical protein